MSRPLDQGTVWLILFSLNPVFSLISKIRLHAALRVISGLVLVFGLVLLAVDLATSFRILHSGAHGGFGAGVAMVEHIRFVTMFFVLLGSGLLASSLLLKK